jgi:hypothetical protein
MGRYIGPACKRCRREGMKLFLKGDRCYMAKCPIEQGHSIPGQHGRRPRLKDYGISCRRSSACATCTGCRKASSACSSSARSAAAASPAKSCCRRWKCAWTTSSTASAWRRRAAPRASLSATAMSGQRPQGQHPLLQGQARRSGPGARHASAAATTPRRIWMPPKAAAWPSWLNVDKAEFKAVVDMCPPARRSRRWSTSSSSSSSTRSNPQFPNPPIRSG